MAWYDDNKRLTYVNSYSSEKDAMKEAERAAKKGWAPQGAASTDGHLNFGRTVGKSATFAVIGTALLGPVGLLGAALGGSRTKGKITLTYVRSPQWLADHVK